MPSHKRKLYGVLEQAIRLGFESEDHIPAQIPEGQMASLVEELHAAIRMLADEQGRDECWLYYRVPVTSNSAHTVIRDLVRPCLQPLSASPGMLGWWWLNKADACGYAIRLRICCTQGGRQDVAHSVSTYLEQARLPVVNLRYEPELRLFGGANGIALAHRFFYADSEFISAWITDFGKPVPLGLSTALLIHMFMAAGIDMFECWDVFDRVAKKRMPSETDVAAAHRLRPVIRGIVRTDPQQLFLLYTEPQRQLISQHARLLSELGRELSRHNCAGKLQIGPREFLMPVVLFHWNRMGISSALQRTVAHALCEELAAVSHEGSAAKSLVEVAG